jgi:SAM-dependent methyltransferase
MKKAAPLERVECRVCGEATFSPFLEVERVPVFCNVLWPQRDAALAAPRGDITLGFCEGCGMIRNLVFDRELVHYSPGYENSLHFSPSFQTYARSLAGRLVERHGLYGKDVIEIGCGKGDFLTMLCENGGNRGVGFDPSYGGEANGSAERIEFVRDYYSEAYAGCAADLICCRHVLEHVEEPSELLLTVRSAAQPGVVLYFEVPNGGYMLERMAVWDVIYEHPSYFTAPALWRLFGECGFDVLDVGTSFGGQYLWIEAATSNGRSGRDGLAGSAPGQLAPLVSAFERRYREKIDWWDRRLGRLLSDGARVALWGAGSKGVTFLNVVRGGDAIGCVVDLNVRKQGRYIPGTGQRIAAPKQLSDYEPDIVLVMNPIYENEIRQWIAAIGMATDIAAV